MKVSSERSLRIRDLIQDPNPRRLYLEIKALKRKGKTDFEIASIFNKYSVPCKKKRWNHHRVSLVFRRFESRIKNRKRAKITRLVYLSF